MFFTFRSSLCDRRADAGENSTAPRDALLPGCRRARIVRRSADSSAMILALVNAVLYLSTDDAAARRYDSPEDRPVPSAVARNSAHDLWIAAGDRRGAEWTVA